MGITIGNFSIGVEEWVSVEDLGSFSVDVTDDTYSIVTSGTYFIHDDQIVSTTYSGISGGYRCYYTPSSVYSSGTITLTMHAENDNSEYLNQNFHFLYGYRCTFDDYVDWGPGKEVVTTLQASNLAFCPNMEAQAFYFETADLRSATLNAFINSIQSVNIGAVIYPQSKSFFYGQTYTVTLSGIKDFYGNIMDPFVFSFTIEDPTI